MLKCAIDKARTQNTSRYKIQIAEQHKALSADIAKSGVFLHWQKVKNDI